MAEPDGLKPGPRDHLITRALEQLLEEIGSDFRTDEGLDPAEGPERLACHAMAEIARHLSNIETAEDQASRLNDLLRPLVPESDDWARAEIALPPRILDGIKPRSPLGQPMDLPPLPRTPFSQSDLLVNGEGQPNIGSELKAELATADSVNLICAFVIWSGVLPLREAIAEVVRRGGRFRVITTTYMGATQKRAVDELFKLGAEIKIAFDARTTKLHAKAWLLERDSGLTTAFIGSSNLSHTALFDGLEWNVRLSSMDAAYVINRVRTMFASHWASEHFDLYNPEVNGDELERALASTIVGRSGRVRRSRLRTWTFAPTRTSSGCLKRSWSSARVTIDIATSLSRRPAQVRRWSPPSIIDSCSSTTARTSRCCSSPTGRRS